MIRKTKLYGTTDSSGDLTVTSQNQITGKLLSVAWIDGTFADGVDAVISVDRDNDLTDLTVLTLTNANDDAEYFPRTPAQDNVGADVTFDATNEIYTEFVLDGKLKMVVSTGGDTKTGGCLVYYEV